MVEKAANLERLLGTQKQGEELILYFLHVKNFEYLKV